jgi:hypothetical protein
MDLEHDVDELLFLINHICMPIRLPNQTNEKDASRTGMFIQHLTKAVDAFSVSAGIRLDEIKQMLTKWDHFQEETLDETKINHAIRSASDSETLSIYMANQNACIMITKKYENRDYNANVSFFQPSFKGEEIISIESDLICRYPFISIDMPSVVILHSETFARQICDLANCENDDSHFHTRKANQEQVEVREVNNPNLVVNWLLPFLLANDGRVIGPDHLTVVEKKMRDDVTYKSTLVPFRRSGMWTSAKVVLQMRMHELYGNNGKFYYKVQKQFYSKFFG